MTDRIDEIKQEIKKHLHILDLVAEYNFLEKQIEQITEEVIKSETVCNAILAIIDMPDYNRTYNKKQGELFLQYIDIVTSEVSKTASRLLF